MPQKDGILRWGICSSGRISNDFVICLNMLSKQSHQIVAVAARDKSKAEEFATKHSIPKAYGSYQELADNPEIEIFRFERQMPGLATLFADIVYVGAIHTEHYRLSKQMLKSGKHVLCEKPLCVNYKQTQSLVKIAKENNLFLMEGIWSRCFPAYEKVRSLLRDEVIGKAQHVQVSFGKYSETLRPRMREKEQAGGALLDLGIYAVQFSQLVFDEDPIEQSSFGSLLKETGVDTACHIFMRFSGNRTAVASTSVLACLPNEAHISGTKGTIKVCYPFWCATRVEVSLNYGPPQVHEFPLPPKSKYGQMNFINSEGFTYEAEEARNCIMKGSVESPLLTWDMSLRIAAVLDSARNQVGYDLPQDHEAYE